MESKFTYNQSTNKCCLFSLLYSNLHTFVTHMTHMALCIQKICIRLCTLNTCTNITLIHKCMHRQHSSRSNKHTKIGTQSRFACTCIQMQMWSFHWSFRVIKTISLELLQLLTVSTAAKIKSPHCAYCSPISA